jgi:beta-barrel assembly-enhancing protease
MTPTPDIRRAAAIALLVFVLAPGTLQAQTSVKSGFNMFSPEQDAEIGRQSAAQAEQQLPIVRDRSVEAFLNEIGQRLAAQAPGPRFNYNFRVVNASDLNAFALPGGYIYLNRGIIESAKTEGEVAGVLAHEIAHVALRHGTQNATKAYMAQAGIGILGGILGGRGGGANTAQIINAVGGLGLNALFLKYSREAETDADVIGAQILARAGYNPADMISFFRTLESADKAKKTTWLSSHPAPPQRIARIEKEARLLNVAPSPTGTTQQLARAQSTLRGLGSARTTEQIAQMNQPGRSVPGSRRGTPQAGAVASPSTQARVYTAPGGLYQISYPADWRVYQGSGHGVTIAPEGGAGEWNGQAEIVYGAVINHYEPFGNVRNRGQQNVTIEEGTEDLIRQIQQGAPHLRVVRGSTSAFRLAGGRGLGATLSGVDPNTRIRERITLVTRQLADGHLLYMLFITPDQDAQRFSGALNAMVGSLRVDEQRRH